ncbi:MAG: lamin tail domain-containing protein, partial [Nitrosopumilaceae archaeon]
MFGFLVVVLLLGQTVPVLGQSGNTDHVVINEVDINPPGDDSKLVSEWIELYNPTNQTVDLGGWSIGATTGLKTTYKVAEGTKLKSGGFITFAFGPLWFPDTSSLIQLKNKNATVVDQTHTLRDLENGLKSWQRIMNGLDTDSSADWAFRISNAGSSNGKTTSSTTSESLSVKVSTDKLIYIFGDLVKIGGEVSKRVTVPHQGYTAQQIHLTITGPEGFEKTFSLFPDRMNMFKTEMKTDKVLRIPEGDYKAVVEYGG